MDRRGNARNKSISSLVGDFILRNNDDTKTDRKKSKDDTFATVVDGSSNNQYSNIIDSILPDSPKQQSSDGGTLIKDKNIIPKSFNNNNEEDEEHNKRKVNRLGLKKIILDHYDSILKIHNPSNQDVLSSKVHHNYHHDDDNSSISSRSCYIEESSTIQNNDGVHGLDDILFHTIDDEEGEDDEILWYNFSKSTDKFKHVLHHANVESKKETKDDGSFQDILVLDDGEESVAESSIHSIHSLDYSKVSVSPVIDNRHPRTESDRSFLGRINRRDEEEDDSSSVLGEIISCVLDKELKWDDEVKNYLKHNDEESIVSNTNECHVPDGNRTNEEPLEESLFMQQIQQEREESWQELVDFILQESRGGHPTAFQSNHLQDIDKERYTQLLLRVQDYRDARSLRRDENSMKIYPLPYGMFGLFQYVDGIRVDLEWAEDVAYRRKYGKPFLSWIDFVATMEDFPKRTFCAWDIPFFTVLLLAISSVMLVGSIYMNGGHFETIHKNPMIGPKVSVLLQMGAVSTEKIVQDGEWLRLLSGIFLHAGLIHWLINIVALVMIAPMIEYIHGSALTTAVFLFSGVGGNLLTSFFSPYQVSVGASGGICSLMGVCFVHGIVNWKLLAIQDEGFHFPYKMVAFTLAVEIMLLVVAGLTPYVDQFAHLGGFFFGICFSSIFVVNLNRSGFFNKNKPSVMQRLCGSCWRLTAFVLAIVLFMSTSVILMQSDGNPDSLPCPKCRYISCIPFPFWKPDIEKWWNCDACDYVALPYELYHKSTSGAAIFLDLTCPDGEIVTGQVDGNTGSTTISSTENELSNDLVRSYCRALCDF